VCRSKHAKPSKSFGIINSITRLHLVGYSQYLIPASLILKTKDDLLAGGNDYTNLISTSFLFPNKLL
jgi:hypothetical protein